MGAPLTLALDAHGQIVRMFSELGKSILELLKLAPRYMISIAIVCGVLLFLPKEALDQIGLLKFSQDYRQWLGFGFLASTTLWSVAMASMAWSWFGKTIRRKSIQKRIIKKLNSLTEDEKQILRYYISKNTRANMLKIDDGVVQELAAEGIIYRSASMGNIIEGFAHNISDIAWDYLHENSHVLNGTTNFYRTDKRERGW
jgi:hypothetical protein